MMQLKKLIQSTHIRARNDDPKRLLVLYFANVYACSMTLVCNKGTQIFKATTPYLARFNLLAIFLLCTNITFNKLKMIFT